MIGRRCVPWTTPYLYLHLFTYLLLYMHLSFMVFAPCRGHTQNDVKALTYDLFIDYDRNIRPFVDSDYPTFVRLILEMTSIVELNEVNQELVISAFIFIDWFDPSFTWDPSFYNDTTVFQYRREYIWTPDIIIVNSAQTLKRLGHKADYLYVYSSGYVVWIPSGVFGTSCDIDVTYYPFDSQSCDITFASSIMTQSDLVLTTTNSLITLEKFSKSGTWEVVNITTSFGATTSNRQTLTFTLKLKRRRTYYMVNLLIPVITLSFMGTLTFALPVDAGEKMGTSVSVVLSYAVYLTLISGEMPRTSLKIPIMAVYLNILLAKTTLGVILSALVLNLHFRDDRQPPSRLTRRLIMLTRRVLFAKKTSSVGVITVKEETPPPISTVCGGQNNIPCFTTGTALATTTTLTGNNNSVVDDFNYSSQKQDLIHTGNNRPAPTSTGSPPGTGSVQRKEAFQDGAARPRSGDGWSTAMGGSDEQEVTWRIVSETLDRFLFVIYTFVLVTLTLGLCLMLHLGSSD